MAYVIRRVSKDDAQQVAQIYVRSWQEDYRGILPDDFLDALMPDTWASSLSAEDAQENNAVMLMDKKPISIVNFQKGQDETGEIGALWLLPEYWGRGWDGMLLEYSMNILRERGCVRAFSWLPEASGRVQITYRRAGFMADGAHKEVEIGGRRVREVRYAREL